MDDFGYIFYLVVIVAAVLSSIIKSFRSKEPKRNTPAPQLDENEDETTTYESEWATPEDETTPFASTFEPQPETMPVAAKPQPEGERTTLHKHTTPTEVPPDEPNVPVIDFADEDDVKRAIVASEILNRKYF